MSRELSYAVDLQKEKILIEKEEEEDSLKKIQQVCEVQGRPGISSAYEKGECSNFRRKTPQKTSKSKQYDIWDPS
ncbi:hypothetical protein L1987_60163 [Smallanthus sonchifolius]|uniref:Uncharacterized protein n=1 Tax=Smallanthus sonchifolius TaxID=185202 RepID=A0ACB9D793_9ASTR|nr:hypothetical protein L1987_60163 [Smallanthus sonchifolius]